MPMAAAGRDVPFTVLETLRQNPGGNPLSYLAFNAVETVVGHRLARIAFRRSASDHNEFLARRF